MTHHAPDPGDFVWDEDEREWWFRCPNCLETGSLDDHRVSYENHKFTVESDVLCSCGQHFQIRDSEFIPA